MPMATPRSSCGMPAATSPGRRNSRQGTSWGRDQSLPQPHRLLTFAVLEVHLLVRDVSDHAPDPDLVHPVGGPRDAADQYGRQAGDVDGHTAIENVCLVEVVVQSSHWVRIPLMRCCSDGRVSW